MNQPLLPLTDDEMETIQALRNGTATVSPVSGGLAINSKLTDAARAGASNLQPSWDNLTPKQHTKIVKALRKNKRDRLDAILEDYASLLTLDELQALLAEGTD